MRLSSSYRGLILPRKARALAGLAALGGMALASSTARAQIAGTAAAPLPDVLLLVDTSGSMQRMLDSSTPACSPGNASDPNKWGMLVQALTGNLQPYYSCQDIDRTSSAFANEFSINGYPPYDASYSLNYARPLSGTGTGTCVFAPHRLPGASNGNGIGPAKQGSGGAATDFPDDAFASVTLSSVLARGGAVDPISTSDQCLYSQALDGQLDAARDFARFALMTFDNVTGPGTGVVGGSIESGTSLVSTVAPSGTPALSGAFSGTWSFVRHAGSPFFGNTAITDPTLGYAQGNPITVPACLPTPQEVGARHEGAPPWEGRLVKFPDANASLFDLERGNDQVQQVLIGSRPYGATPIDGMMDDARDYYNYYTKGESQDAYRACRKRFIVLLTDGAPNLDLRPSCVGPTPSTSACPFPQNAGEIANSLVLDGTAPVTTYVIGFAVAGETAATGNGFPGGVPQNCKGWYEDGSSSGGHNDPNVLQSVCISSNPPAGSTAAACCKLNEIALKGSSGPSPAVPTGAFFAESQADISLAFGRIMANITRDATTRTTPVSTPPSQAGSLPSATTPASAMFVASFFPSTQRPWSGELDRSRYQCLGAGAPPTKQPESQSLGDSTAYDLAQQSSAGRRLFITALADALPTAIDSAATIRPFATGKDGIKAPDNTLRYAATEAAVPNTQRAPTPLTAAAFNITDRTCTKGRAILQHAASLPGPSSQIIPALDKDQCTEVAWGFATAISQPLQYPSTGYPYDFNVRCNTSVGSNTGGTWSVSGGACTLGSGSPPQPGEVCVPSCAALGAIFHANPVVLGPPAAYSRDEGYTTFQTTWRARQPVTFAVSTDGLLHAFKSLGTTPSDAELWAFIPPAVLPRLVTNYPAGNQVLLDGTPVVTETVWDRLSTSSAPGQDWHTTLVAGLGNGRGYYALNVTDPDCSGGGGGSCVTGGYQAPPEANLGYVSNSGVLAPTTGVTPKAGPHFLWQLTDIPSASGAETAKVDRVSTIGAPTNPVQMRALFGQHTSTPAIGMVQILDTTGVQHQVGVAILPGGYEDPPVPGASCPRGGAPSIADQPSGALTTFAVRRWGAGCGDAAPVPGRGVTIVRLDTGEIVRHFGREIDTPLQVQARGFTRVEFDSPMVGTPVVYPSTVAVPMQKIFIGDADGALWRIDVSNVDPARWAVSLFQDIAAPTKVPAERQPIQVAPVVSTDDVGNVVLHVATGDQDSITYDAGARNYVFSLTETRDTVANLPISHVNWYVDMQNGERVTGPMTVFNRNVYFASYLPTSTAQACNASGSTARLWGLDYVQAANTSARTGPLPRWCAAPDPNGLCATPSTNVSAGTDIIPGVTLQASSTCATPDSVPTDVLGSTGAFSQLTPVQYNLSYGISRRTSNAAALSAQAERQNVTLPLPRMATKIDSWAIVIE